MKLSSVVSGFVLSLIGLMLPVQCVEALGAASTVATPALRADVTLKVTTDQARYTSGQPIQVSLTATNTTRNMVNLSFPSAQRFDFSVYLAGHSETVYTWSASRSFAQVVGALQLKPRQSLTYEATIGDEMGQLKPGKYRLLAYLTSSPRRIAAVPIEFEVVDLHLALAAHANQESYKIGDSVQIAIAVVNRAATANRVPFDSGMTFDIFISDASDNLVWSYGANLRFIQALRAVTWQKGETKTYSAVWNGVALPGYDQLAKLAPGRYRVQAVLASTPRLYAPPVYIDLTR